VDHRGKDDPLYSGRDGGFDEATADIRFIRHESGGNVEYALDALEGTLQARRVRKIRDD
jgi:hypothetical protein